MKVEFRDVLSEDEIQSAKRLYRQLNDVSIFQFISLPILPAANSQLKYAVVTDDEENFIGYSVIIESHSNRLPFIRTAKIQFGPVCGQTDAEIFLLSEIYRYYKAHNFATVEIQLRHVEGQQSEKIITALANIFPFHHKSDKNNRCTIHIDLTKTIQEIENDFTSDLSRNLKKANNKNVKVRAVESDEEIKEFASLYMKMGNKRGIIHYTENYLFDFCKFLVETGNGFLLCSFIDEKMIGGGLFIEQGNKTEYEIGATDPDFKKIPSSHLVLFEAIKYAKERGKKIFDMGGIGYYAKPDEQIYSINQFKENFSKNYIFYAKVLYADTNRLNKWLLDLLVWLNRLKS